MTRAIKKITTSHKSLRQACFHVINIFVLKVFLASKSPNLPWMVSNTVITNNYQPALLVEFQKNQALFDCRVWYPVKYFYEAFVLIVSGEKRTIFIQKV